MIFEEAPSVSLGRTRAETGSGEPSSTVRRARRTCWRVRRKLIPLNYTIIFVANSQAAQGSWTTQYQNASCMPPPGRIHQTSIVFD
jgi:hypothetical protein